MCNYSIILYWRQFINALLTKEYGIRTANRGWPWPFQQMLPCFEQLSPVLFRTRVHRLFTPTQTTRSCFYTWFFCCECEKWLFLRPSSDRESAITAEKIFRAAAKAMNIFLVLKINSSAARSEGANCWSGQKTWNMILLEMGFFLPLGS